MLITIIQLRNSKQHMSACVNKNQWPKSNHGFFLYSPLLRKVAGMPRTLRIKGAHETEATTNNEGTAHKCSICKGYGHNWKSCKEEVALMPSKHL
jgi:hypothetical protein